ncbi:MAG TPA: TPM domain-containing protein [Polyangiales bacterium]|nr:TPM domain-containing protein [Polyangiales bacterium]
MSRGFVVSRSSIALAVLALGFLPSLASALEVPTLSGRVNDYAGIISPEAEVRIEQTLAALERDKGAQVVVLTIEALDGEQLEDYSLRVAESWKLGRADQDDGALLFIVKNDRKMRLEVGYGLEPYLSDVMSRRILDQILRPSFRAGDFDGGIERAVEAIDGLIRGTSTLPAPEPSPFEGDLPTQMFGLLWFLFLIPFVFTVLGTNPFQWFLYLFLIPFVYVGGLTLLGPNASPVFVAAWLIGAPIVWSFFGRRRKKRKPGTRRRGSGWSGGSWSSGGGGFSSSGGGGFSGGGGSFGGGGSSSSW